jgi:hypothetical protein
LPQGWYKHHNFSTARSLHLLTPKSRSPLCCQHRSLGNGRASLLADGRREELSTHNEFQQTYD